jgi:hypothetical protein
VNSADTIRLHLRAVARLAVTRSRAAAQAAGRKYMAARPVLPTRPAVAVPTCAAPQAARMCQAGSVLVLSSGLMPLRAWVKEQPNVTSARGGTRVRKDLRHRLPVAFVVVVEGPNSLLVVLMAAVVGLIIASRRSVMSQQLQHSIASWSIG